MDLIVQFIGLLHLLKWFKVYFWTKWLTNNTLQVLNSEVGLAVLSLFCIWTEFKRCFVQCLCNCGTKETGAFQGETLTIKNLGIGPRPLWCRQIAKQNSVFGFLWFYLFQYVTPAMDLSLVEHNGEIFSFVNWYFLYVGIHIGT